MDERALRLSSSLPGWKREKQGRNGNRIAHERGMDGQTDGWLLAYDGKVIAYEQLAKGRTLNCHKRGQ